MSVGILIKGGGVFNSYMGSLGVRISIFFKNME